MHMNCVLKNITCVLSSKKVEKERKKITSLE
jgi:hypothetical protein